MKSPQIQCNTIDFTFGPPLIGDVRLSGYIYHIAATSTFNQLCQPSYGRPILTYRRSTKMRVDVEYILTAMLLNFV